MGILELSNEYMMPRLTSLCELYIQNEVNRATSESLPLADIDVICKYNSLYPHTLLSYPTLIHSYHHTTTHIPSYHNPSTPSLISLLSYPTLIPYPHILISLPSYLPSYPTLIPYPHTPTLIPSYHYPHTIIPLPTYHYPHTPLTQYMTPRDTHWCQNMTPIDAKHNT